MPNSAMARMKIPAPRTEIPDVKPDKQLEDDATPAREVAVLVPGSTASHPTRHPSADHEDKGRDESQPRHQPQNGRLRRLEQRVAAQDAAQ